MYSRKAKQIGKFRSYKLLLSIFTGTLLLILYVAMHVYIISLENNIHEIRNQYSDLNMKTNNLKIEVAVLHKGSRIKNIAYENLGMRMPEGVPEKLF